LRTKRKLQIERCYTHYGETDTNWYFYLVRYEVRTNEVNLFLGIANKQKNATCETYQTKEIIFLLLLDIDIHIDLN
jgi:hypothetical protein